MNVNTRQAIKLFFQNPSLDMVFKEAIANSLDANATKIDVHVFIDSFEKQETLVVEIVDNGEGFTDERYEKFCELLKVDEETHQGVGRLVYLSYFDKISIKSRYGKELRTFTFDCDFDKEQSDMQKQFFDDEKRETHISFEQCSLKRLSSYDVIRPDYLRQQIMQEFYPRLYFLKKDKKDFCITFTIEIPHLKRNHVVGAYETKIVPNDILDMQTEDVDVSVIKMFEPAYLDYAIQKQSTFGRTFLMTALCIDNRTKNLDDIIACENLPRYDYNIIFILRSSIFNGKIDPSRQTLTLNENILKAIKTIFRKKVAEIIEKEIPTIKDQNKKTRDNLNKTYPHLVGYFNDDEVGIISRSKSIEEAQKLFMRDQKDILEANGLSNEEYDKALDVSSRTLAQYIVYREKIISKVEQLTSKDSEADLHNLILPKRSVLQNSDMDSIYNNNLWLLDNKYMTYTTAMSERTMGEVLDEIAQGANKIEDNGRPDIAIIFSNDPNISDNKSVDVVIIELKKRGITLAKTEEVESQLQQRAIKLLNYYPNKIQRMWFYGIVEFNDDFKLSLLNEKYRPLYSKDQLYYKENSWRKSLDDPTEYIVGTYILSIDAFINDAKAHNEIFLNILKEGFKQKKDE